MPYKDPEQKKEWEWRHRAQRLARRRELRRIEATHKATQPIAPDRWSGNDFPWFAVAAGGGLALYNPMLGFAAGSLVLVAAALGKLGWFWWVAGVLILALAFFLQWIGRDEAV
jgi:hypothetical protein